MVLMPDELYADEKPMAKEMKPMDFPMSEKVSDAMHNAGQKIEEASHFDEVRTWMNSAANSMEQHPHEHEVSHHDDEMKMRDEGVHKNWWY